MKEVEITDYIKTIERLAYQDADDEAAHSMEDDLRNDFIRYIAERNDHLGKKARLILSTNNIEFSRWCA